jgi:hypothetical protein
MAELPRTRKDRNLELRSDPHTDAQPDRYIISIKVIDIFKKTR